MTSTINIGGDNFYRDVSNKTVDQNIAPIVRSLEKMATVAKNKISLNDFLS